MKPYTEIRDGKRIVSDWVFKKRIVTSLDTLSEALTEMGFGEYTQVNGFFDKNQHAYLFIHKMDKSLSICIEESRYDDYCPLEDPIARVCYVDKTEDMGLPYELEESISLLIHLIRQVWVNPAH